MVIEIVAVGILTLEPYLLGESQMSQGANRQQAKRDFLNVAKAVFADGEFGDWISTMIFLGIPIVFGLNLYMFLDGCLRNIIFPIFISPLVRTIGINSLDSWVIGYIKIGAMYLDIFTFVTMSFILFVINRIIRKRI
jgi:hypothetical protein